LLFITY